MIETAFLMVTVVCHLKKISQRLEGYIDARMAYVSAMFNMLLTLYHQLHPDQPAHKMSIAEFSL
jgi:hypothetical protein